MMNGPCLEWGGARTKAGYGQVRIAPNVKVYAHRVAYADYMGIPLSELDGVVIRHSCDNPACFNPAHLLPGTHADNSADKVSRGRQAKGSALPQTVLTPEQVAYIRENYQPRHREYGARALGRKFGVTHETIRAVLTGRTHK